MFSQNPPPQLYKLTEMYHFGPILAFTSISYVFCIDSNNKRGSYWRDQDGSKAQNLVPFNFRTDKLSNDTPYAYGVLAKTISGFLELKGGGQ